MTSLELKAYTYKAKEQAERKLCVLSRPSLLPFAVNSQLMAAPNQELKASPHKILVCSYESIVISKT